jgi:hypothetical protein
MNSYQSEPLENLSSVLAAVVKTLTGLLLSRFKSGFGLAHSLNAAPFGFFTNETSNSGRHARVAILMSDPIE